MVNVFRWISSLISPEKYPNHFIRGITQETSVLQKNDYVVISASAFDFNKPKKQNYVGKLEMSINWMDDDGAIEQAMNQLKNGKIQFIAGLVKLRKAILDDLRKTHLFIDSLSYNRQRLDDNDYHGNVLLEDRDKRMNNVLKCILAAQFSLKGEYIPRDE